MLRDHEAEQLMPAMFQSITFKVLGVGVLALLMLIPLAEVQGLIGERLILRAMVNHRRNCFASGERRQARAAGLGVLHDADDRPAPWGPA